MKSGLVGADDWGHLRIDQVRQFDSFLCDFGSEGIQCFFDAGLYPNGFFHQFRLAGLQLREIEDVVDD